jgi:hypothetical protein
MATDTTGWSRKEVLDYRAGYISGVFAMAKSYGAKVLLSTAEVYAKTEYPMPTREVENVVEAMDNEGTMCQFRVTDIASRRVEYQYAGDGRGWDTLDDDYWPDLTPEELRAIASVKERPTVTREIE